MTERHAATSAMGRPFGAHLSMRRWVPILLTVVVVVSLYGLQLLLLALTAIVEVGMLDKDPTDSTLTPLTYLASNVSIVLIAPITLFVLAKAGRLPWRSVLTVGRRFGWHRLGRYLAVSTVLLAAANVAVFAFEPASLSAFAVTSTTVALLVIVVLTTPLQAAAEEIVFRGAMTAAYATWIRAVRPALALGIAMSSLLFMAVHTSTDPWMNMHYVGLGASTAIMALIARGLEPAIAFHVVNNVLSMGLGAMFTHGGGVPQDRTAGTAGPSMLLLLVAQVLAVLAVWWMERKRPDRTSSDAP